MTNKNPWKTISSKEVYKNPWITVREDQVIRPDGKKGIYGVVEIKPSIFIVAINDKNEICLINLFRYTTNNFSWEVPGGGCEDFDNLENAKRELFEETGLVAKNWKLAGKYHSLNGVVDDVCYVFLAQGLTANLPTGQTEEGINQIRFCSETEIKDMIKKGELNDGQTIAAITIALTCR